MKDKLKKTQYKTQVNSNNQFYQKQKQMSDHNLNKYTKKNKLRLIDAEMKINLES